MVKNLGQVSPHGFIPYLASMMLSVVLLLQVINMTSVIFIKFP